MQPLKIVFILLTLFLFSSVLKSQNGLITGIVVEDVTSLPIPYAMVYAEGTTIGTTTDLDGKFSLSLPAGTYILKVSFMSFHTLTIKDLVVESDRVQTFNNLRMVESTISLEGVVVSATQVRTTESSLQALKQKSAVMLDGISASKIQLIGDANAVEAAKRVTGVTIEDGKYVYVRGLGDRYSKTILNGVDIPGLDPDKNSLQMDIFPTI